MVFFDSDGVFANWSGYVLPTHFPDLKDVDELTALPKSVYEPRMRAVYITDPDIFSKLKPITGSECLIAACEELSIPWSILTAAGEDHYSYDHVRVCKEQWFARYYDLSVEKVVVSRRSSDKKLYAAPGRVLVDDFLRNCEEWAAAGGTAIHCKSNEPNFKEILRVIKSCHEDAFNISPGVISV